MKGVDASYHYEGYDVYKAALRSERPRQKPGLMPDKMITCLFGKAVSAALPFYIAGRFSSGDLPAITIL